MEWRWIDITDFRSKCKSPDTNPGYILKISEERCLLRFIEFLKRKMRREPIRYTRLKIFKYLLIVWFLWNNQRSNEISSQLLYRSLYFYLQMCWFLYCSHLCEATPLNVVQPIARFVYIQLKSILARELYSISSGFSRATSVVCVGVYCLMSRAAIKVLMDLLRV